MEVSGNTPMFWPVETVDDRAEPYPKLWFITAVTAIAEVTTMENVLRVVDTSASSAAVSMPTLRSANTANDRLDYSN
ncbi:hypothetical protein F441_17316 [Phytophthora nicotianae CJ01A1]|uniref:Uncharacterized protein n=2 Tax=Phytophthora nicotianae TaxID=4792 RepID=W2G161_PHYNI|nr:hypothetical protein L915_16970 [Phytophthora nicotianae]ETL30109.1 hypothetical protein L916_16869 [Phytophthora nicotianae]ETP06266.1 hypothetical protein F441_17316 [Phytophthora nicotianae CJ01A1]